MWMTTLFVLGHAGAIQASNWPLVSSVSLQLEASQVEHVPTAEVWYHLDGPDSILNVTFKVDRDRSTPGITWLVGDGSINDLDGESGRVHIMFPIRAAPGALGIASDGSALLRMPKSQTLMVIERSATPPADQEDYRLWNASGTVADISIDRGFAENAGAQPALAFASALAALLGEDLCSPSFQECKDAAKDACAPDRYEVSYSCNPETGEVSCSWTCHVAARARSGTRCAEIVRRRPDLVRRLALP